MTQRTPTTAPPGWQSAVSVDSRLEADLAAHMLAAQGIAAEVVELGALEFVVFVAEDDRATAAAILDVT